MIITDHQHTTPLDPRCMEIHGTTGADVRAAQVRRERPPRRAKRWQRLAARQRRQIRHCCQCEGTGMGTGADGGRSLLGVARGVFRLAAPFCGRALPIPVADGCRALPCMPGALPGRWLTRLPFSLRALGGRLLCAELLLGRGVGVFGRPFAPGRGVGVLRVGLRDAGPASCGSGIALAAMVSAIVVARLRGGEAASAAAARTPRCELYGRVCACG